MYRHICVDTCVYRGQKGVWDSKKVELQVVVSHLMWTGSQTWRVSRSNMKS